MLRKLYLASVLGLALIPATEARALCSGGTVAHEYRDASIVVRARLVSQMDAWDDSPSPSFKKQWGDGSTSQRGLLKWF